MDVIFLRWIRNTPKDRIEKITSEGLSGFLCTRAFTGDTVQTEVGQYGTMFEQKRSQINLRSSSLRFNYLSVFVSR